MIQPGRSRPCPPYSVALAAAPRRSSSAMRAVVLFGILGACCCGVLQAQIAPGPLSRAHAALSSVIRCASCHDFGARRLKCLECHDEIKRRVEARTGFHARAYKSSYGETDCARCHAEHRGPKFKLIPLDRQSFDHGTQTGFTLEGKHREQRCESCHNPARMDAAARAEIKMRDLSRSFLGLHRRCTFCHQEPHRNQLGTECLGCHTPDAWRPASRFNHSRAPFVLTGQHQRLSCDKCHARTEPVRFGGKPSECTPAGSSPSQKVLLFKGLDFSGCQSCHADQHHGAFQEVKVGGKCDGCHVTDGWQINRAAARFNHSLTRFRLVGRHATLPCEKCHKECNFGRPIAHERCGNCHEDPHKGQFASRPGGSDCSACHSPAGFKPPLFDREAHMRSAFPLLGKHATLPCGKCHQPEGRAARFKTGRLLCPSCHAEPHGGEFTAEPYSNRCDLCHTPAGFEATTFTRERHAQTKFPLTGRHAEVPCEKCHKPLAPFVPKTSPEIATSTIDATSLVTTDRSANARRKFHFASRDCDTCHADPHGFSPGSSLPCATCHVTRGWKDRIPFDHSRTGFKLTGSHQDAAHPIPCVRCHTPSGQADGAAQAAPSFPVASSRCARCHLERDAHGGQFRSPVDRQRDCSDCHVPTAWNGGAFSHDNTRFALNSVHRKLSCTQCHKNRKEVNGKLVVQYRGTPVECLKCH